MKKRRISGGIQCESHNTKIFVFKIKVTHRSGYFISSLLYFIFSNFPFKLFKRKCVVNYRIVEEKKLANVPAHRKLRN